MKKISVIGLGYVGLPTAILAAQAGLDVFGFDVDIEKVERIKKGTPSILEPEILSRLDQVLKSGKFNIDFQLQPADCFLIAVPTPLTEDKKADMSHVFEAGKEIARVLKPGNLVVLESTVKVGTTEKLAKLLEEKSGLKLGIDFYVAHCPERVLPGRAFKELVENDRIIGEVCVASGQLACQFYSKFVKGTLEITDDKTAEMIKLIENSSRDVQIAFANQVEAISRMAGVDSYKVIELANKHPRVNILTPTCGVGGHCIAVDPWFLIESFAEQAKLLHVARLINDRKPLQTVKTVLEKVTDMQALKSYKVKVGALGATFKPDVDDIRQSPALKVLLDLNNKREEKFDLFVYDPYVDQNFFAKNNLVTVGSLDELLKMTDLIVILVKHEPFLKIKKEQLKDKEVIDSCGLLHHINKLASKTLLDVAVKDKSNLRQATF